MKMPDAGPARVFIYGSCVSRDSFSTLPRERWHLTRYVARQSLCSAHAGPAGVPIPVIASPFQRRMVEADVRGDLREQLERCRGTLDLLLWDLVDERLGVVVDPGAEDRVITRSVESISAGLDGATKGWRHVAFGTSEHLRLWRDALGWFTSVLDEFALRDRVVLLNVPWAERSTTGSDVPPSFGLSASEANKLFPAYIDSAMQAGVATLNLTADVAVSDPDHMWGPAPFHYDKSTYDEVRKLLEEAC